MWYGGVCHPRTSRNATGTNASYLMHLSPEEQLLRAYDDHADAIFRHCFFRVSSDRERAKDLVQETFVKTWEYLSQGHEVQNIRAFLYRVATNLIIDASRRKKMYSLDELTDDGFDPPDGKSEDDKAIHRHIDARRMIPLLSKLDGLYREAIVMRFIDDMTPREIAAITGETENVISVRVYRGIKKLRAIMQDTSALS
jgi:RNA polymerase sigma-70 factor, ECF subfamily